MRSAHGVWLLFSSDTLTKVNHIITLLLISYYRENEEAQSPAQLAQVVPVAPEYEKPAPEKLGLTTCTNRGHRTASGWWNLKHDSVVVFADIQVQCKTHLHAQSCSLAQAVLLRGSCSLAQEVAVVLLKR